MTVVDIAYGRGRLAVALPDGAVPTVFRKTALSQLDDPAAAVADAYSDPVGSLPLADLARGRRSACIVICDVTRPVPNGLLLRPLIETLLAAGMPASNITVLVATGLHRPSSDAELTELVGDEWVAERVRVVNHDAHDASALLRLGRTSTRGTPIVINKQFTDAELRIVTGLVEPHFMAGWSGGRKVVAPGIAGAETIRTFHSFPFMASPFATQCNLVDNPLHEEQLQIVATIGEVYAVNTVLDEDRRLLHVNFGDIVESHLAAVDVAEKTSMVTARHQFTTVVTSGGGYPLDSTYYQTVKGMVTPLDILRPGGTLIIASACNDGLGSREFAGSQRRLTAAGPQRFLDDLSSKPLADVDEWQTQMQLRSQKVGEVQLFTDGLDDRARRLTGVTLIADLRAAISRSIQRSADPEVALIPDGPYTIPIRTRTDRARPAASPNGSTRDAVP